jgi:hypothetical protein
MTFTDAWALCRRTGAIKDDPSSIASAVDAQEVVKLYRRSTNWARRILGAQVITFCLVSSAEPRASPTAAEPAGPQAQPYVCLYRPAAVAGRGTQPLPTAREHHATRRGRPTTTGACSARVRPGPSTRCTHRGAPRDPAAENPPQSDARVARGCATCRPAIYQMGDRGARPRGPRAQAAPMKRRQSKASRARALPAAARSPTTWTRGSLRSHSAERLRATP